MKANGIYNYQTSIRVLDGPLGIESILENFELIVSKLEEIYMYHMDR